MIVYPAVDILEGKCVRLRQGRYDAVTIYADDPSEMAVYWEEQGAEVLHVVDLDGAATGKPVNLPAIARITSRVHIPVQLGGGLRTKVDITAAFDAGVDRVVLGSSLVTDVEFVADVCSACAGRVVAGIDARDGRVSIQGWTEDAGRSVVELAGALRNVGLAGIVYTDILVDGTQSGPNLAGLKELAGEIDVPLIASGGVATLRDIAAISKLEPLGVQGVIIGRALYEKAFTLGEAIEVAKG